MLRQPEEEGGLDVAVLAPPRQPSEPEPRPGSAGSLMAIAAIWSTQTPYSPASKVQSEDRHPPAAGHSRWRAHAGWRVGPCSERLKTLLHRSSA